MRKIDLDELYGGSWRWIEEDPLSVKFRGSDLDVKSLKDHLEEWVKIPTDPEKLSFGCLNDEAVTHLLDILEGRITELDNDDGVIKFEYDNLCEDKEDKENWCNEEDYVVFEPLSMIKDKIRDEAREQGIKPPKTWYREEVDRLAYNAVNPDLPF